MASKSPSKEKEKIKKSTLSLFERLFAGFRRSEPGEGQTEDQTAFGDSLPTTAHYDEYYSSMVDPATGRIIIPGSGEDGQSLHEMPRERLIKYAVLETMATDPTIDSALKMHITHALSAEKNTNEIISIESTSEKEDKIVIDLRNTFKEMFNKNLQSWAYNTALLGSWPVRIYGSEGRGVELIRSDYYCHPRFITAYEKAGQEVGFTSAYQSAFQGLSRLIEPWKFAMFKMPIWKIPSDIEPIRVDSKEFDISDDNFMNESIVESQNYGVSLLETAFNPWMDLQEAILSLNMSRKNASRLERLVGVNTGKLNPVKAAQYLNVVAKRIQEVGKARSEQSLKRGFLQTVVNHILPIFGDSKGRLDVSTIESSPNIDGLADLDFHIKRLGSALGVDPSLVGFGEMLSGGLGDGGFFRLSILAAIKANMVRTAMATGIEKIFDIHVAYKFGKVFVPSEKPWRVIFNSTSSALEREEAENAESRANFATLVSQLIQTLDPEMTGIDKDALNNFVYTDILKWDEDKVRKMFPKSKVNNTEAGTEGDGIMESAGESGIKEIVYNILNEFYEKKRC